MLFSEITPSLTNKFPMTIVTSVTDDNSYLLEQLRMENAALKQENQDLHITLTTITEHGDMIEALLNETSVKLRAEVNERKRAEAKLQSILNLISRQKEDLEIIVETIMEHGDVVDAQWRQKLYETAALVNLDGLTQIPNRRRFDQYIEEQWQVLAQKQEPLGLILCDIDFFKQFNDFYGHLTGDDCLRRIAHALSAILRSPYDLFARFGGEEFAAILPYTDEQGAYYTGIRMQAALGLLEIPHHHSAISHQVTMSIGVAAIIPQLDGSPLTLIDEADRRLYWSKERGRNRITHYPVPQV